MKKGEVRGRSREEKARWQRRRLQEGGAWPPVYQQQHTPSIFVQPVLVVDIHAADSIYVIRPLTTHAFFKSFCSSPEYFVLLNKSIGQSILYFSQIKVCFVFCFLTCTVCLVQSVLYSTRYLAQAVA